MNGRVKEILIAKEAGAKPVSVDSATLIAGKGIVGDRYFTGDGKFSERLAGLPDVEITLIESEQVEAFNKIANKRFVPADFRRNIVTAGVQLNDLVGIAFKIGPVQLNGIRLCEPCAYLSNILGDEIMEFMLHKAGLRAQIVQGGNISVANTVIA